MQSDPAEGGTDTSTTRLQPIASDSPSASPTPAPCSAEVNVQVANASGLEAALVAAQSCTVISLASGDYGDLEIYNRRFENFVTLRSVDQHQPAVFGRIEVGYSSYLRFDGVDVHHPMRAGEHEFARAFDISESHHIEVWRSTIRGSDDGNFRNDIYGFGTGYNTDDIVFANNTLHDLFRGSVLGGRHIVIKGNTYYNLRSDGIDVGGGNHILVEGNTFYDFYPCCEDHPDHIQFFNNGNTTALQNVVVRGNTSLRGRGDWTQSIFVQSNVAGLPNQNFLIENNVVYNDHLHGITVADTDGVVIRNNTVLADRGDALTPSINAYNTRATEIYDNVATAFFPSVAGQNGNVLVQNENPNLDNHYDRVFFDGNAGIAASRASFLPKPGGLLSRTGADIGALDYEAVPMSLSARILTDVTSNPIPLAVHFDGGLSFSPNGEIIEWAWDFGDGQSTQGRSVEHVFLVEGTYVVTLTITNVSGARDHTQKVITALPFALANFPLYLSVEGDTQDYSGHGHEVQCSTQGCPTFVAGRFGQAVAFDGTANGPGLYVLPRWDLDGMQELSIAFWAKKASVVGGQVVKKHGIYSVAIQDNRIEGYLFNSTGQQAIFNVPLDVNLGTEWHHFAVTYDGAHIRFFVDGVLKGNQAFSGSVAGQSDTGVDVGKDVFGLAFNGALDEIRLYRRVLAAAEISSLGACGAEFCR